MHIVHNLTYFKDLHIPPNLSNKYVYFKLWTQSIIKYSKTQVMQQNEHIFMHRQSVSMPWPCTISYICRCRVPQYDVIKSSDIRQGRFASNGIPFDTEDYDPKCLGMISQYPLCLMGIDKNKTFFGAYNDGATKIEGRGVCFPFLVTLRDTATGKALSKIAYFCFFFLIRWNAKASFNHAEQY